MSRPSNILNTKKPIVEKPLDTPKTVRLTLDFKTDLHTKLKAYAANNRTTILAVVSKLVDKFLSERDNSR